MSDRLIQLLHRAYMQPFSIQSNLARNNAAHVAELASRGLLTTQVWSNAYGNHWRLTPAGLALLQMTTLGETDDCQSDAD